MPIIDVDEQELQMIVNALAMTHPLVAKLMRQHQEQGNANNHAQRRSAEQQAYDEISGARPVAATGPARGGNSRDAGTL